MKLLYSAFTVLSLSVRSSGFAPGRLLSSTQRNTMVTDWKSSSTTSQMSFIHRLLYPAFRPFHCAASSSSDNINAMSNDSQVATLVGDNLRQEHGWSDSIVAFDGCVYGIPSYAHRVIKFDPKDNSTTTIGDDLGCGSCKWWGGVEANNGCIYAVPWDKERNILKIDIQHQVVGKLKAKLPQSNVRHTRWGRGAIGHDGCIYYFPRTADRILKLDPSNDTVSSVGNNLQTTRRGRKDLFTGTMKMDDGCLIGIPYESKRIIKFDPKEPHTTTMVGEEAEKTFYCWGDRVVLGGDGNVYVVTWNGKILQIDVANNRHSFVAEAPEFTRRGWYSAVAGMDGNIYFPPDEASHVLKYDVTTQQTSLVGDDLGDGRRKYRGGALDQFDGKIYCLPFRADRVLSIDMNVTTQTRQNSAKRTRDQGGVETCTTIANDHNRSPDSSSIYYANNCQNDVVPHIENDNAVDDAGDNGGSNGGGTQSTTMQRLFQVAQYVQLIQGVDNPHPSVTASAERMAEACGMLTDRYLEEIQNENQNSNSE